MFLGDVVGMVVHCFSLFETNVPDNKGWYYRKKSWHKEALYGKTAKNTKEFFGKAERGAWSTDKVTALSQGKIKVGINGILGFILTKNVLESLVQM